MHSAQHHIRSNIIFCLSVVAMSCGLFAMQSTSSTHHTNASADDNAYAIARDLKAAIGTENRAQIEQHLAQAKAIRSSVGDDHPINDIITRAEKIIDEYKAMHAAPKPASTPSSDSKAEAENADNKAVKTSQSLTKIAAPPATRNLIMLFDDGFDAGHMIGTLAAALTQKSAFILITPALWQLFCKKTVSDEKPVILVDEALKKSLEKDRSYTSIFFVPSEWKSYQVDVVKNDVFFYLLVPNKYRTKISGHGDPSDQILGLNVTALKAIDLPIIAPKTTYSDNFRRDGNVAKALAQALVASRKRQIFNYSWNVYCTGHGTPTEKLNEITQKIKMLQASKTKPSAKDEKEINELYNKKGGLIANLSVPSFQALANFFNDRVYTNFFLYSTCYAGGQHIVTPYLSTIGTPAKLNYPIIAMALISAPTTGWGGILSSTPQLDIRFKCELHTINSTLPPGWFGVDGDFKGFFADLEGFATGKKIYEKAPAANVPFLQKNRGETQTPANQAASSLASPLTKACNYVGNFLTQDLTAIKTLENIPQIRFPGTEWFQVMRLDQEIGLVSITKAKVIAKNIEAKQIGNKNFVFDLSGKIALLQSNNVAVPLIIDTKTNLVPLINTIHFFEPQGQTATTEFNALFDKEKVPDIFHLSALTSIDGLFKILSAVFFNKRRTTPENTVFLIDKLLCVNDLSVEHKKVLGANDPLQLHDVMIFMKTKNPFLSYQRYTVFGINEQNIPIVISINAGEDIYDTDNFYDPSQVDKKIAERYQETYRTLRKSCTNDRGVEYYQLDQAALKHQWEIKAEAEAKTWIQTAQTKMSSQNPEDKKAALALFKNLVLKGKNFDEALAAATDGIKNNSWNVIWNARDLFKALFDKNYGLIKATALAAENIKSNSSRIRGGAIELFSVLLPQKHGLTEFYTALPTITKDDQKAANKLQKIVTDTFTPEEIAKAKNAAAIKGLLTLGDPMQAKAKAEAETKASIQTAQTKMSSQTPEDKKAALDFFTNLVLKGKNFDEALAAATVGIKNDNWAVIWKARDLFKALFDKNYGLIKATALVAENIKSYSYYIRGGAIELFRVLLPQKHGLMEFYSALPTIIKDDQKAANELQKIATDTFTKEEIAKATAEAEAKAKAEAAAQAKAETDLEV